jgi:two-component system phosphate regulon sensor histidine kinase PhoR
VTVECIVPPDLVVLADERQLVRVLTNLLDNARRFSPRGGRITVGSRASDEPDRVEAFVADEGPGIPPRDVDRVFERFYRGDASRGGEGQGLGLAVTRHIVEGHGGRIWVDTSPPTGGQTGTTMRFTLPLA